MGDGPCCRVWMTILLITNLDYILANKHMQNGVEFCSKDNFNKIQCIQSLVIDPDPFALDSLWDLFPCPPPWKPELILDLQWETKLPADGQRLMSRVAHRCGLDLLSLESLTSKDKGDLIFKDCDINCFLLLLTAFICVVFLVVAVTAFFIRRRSQKRWQDKANSASTTSGVNYHPVSTGNRSTEVILANGRVTTQLEGETDQIKAFQNPKYYGKYYDSQLSRVNNVYDSDDSPRQVKINAEEASLSYSASGTDTTHTYESIRGSINSGSYRFSDAFPKYLLEAPPPRSQVHEDQTDIANEIVPLQRQFYSVERRSGTGGAVSVASYPRSNCSCPRCSQIASQQIPIPPITCRCGRCSQLSNYQSGGTGYGSDGYTDYGIYNRSVMAPSGGFSDTEGVDGRRRRRHRSESGYVEDDNGYSDKVGETTKTNEKAMFLPSTRAYYQIDYNQKCTCKRCSQNRLVMSDEEKVPYFDASNSGRSEFYGVPERTYPAQYVVEQNSQQCHCKRCSQNSINLAEMYDFREKSLYDQNGPASISVNNRSEHRKRKRNKLHRPSSLTTSSDDTNTGSEKSFRSGVPKTNGSLLNSKFVHR